MTYFISKPLLLVVCLLICSSYASKFSCNDLDTTACKTKYAKQFGDDFKTLHLTTMRKLYITYLDIGKKISADLSEGDEFKPMLVQSLTKVTNDLEELNGDIDEPEKIAAIIRKAMNDMALDVRSNEIKNTDFKQLSDKYQLEKSILDIIHQVHTDTGKLWAAQYAGLRPEDIKAYPQYVVVNDLMEKLALPGNDPRKPGYFSNAADILDEDFQIAYFEYNNGMA